MAKLQDRLRALQDATNQYIDAETTRLKNEAKALQAILEGRTAGRGIQKLSTAAVAAVAYSDLADFLSS